MVAEVGASASVTEPVKEAKVAATVAMALIATAMLALMVTTTTTTWLSSGLRAGSDSQSCRCSR